MSASDSGNVAFLFPGQGAQSVGMGATVRHEAPAARELFDQAGEILGYDLYKLCTEGPEEELDTTVRSQPALYVASLAALEHLKQRSPEVVAGCRAAAGLSLGEYTALAFAGAIDFEDGLRVVQERGQAMQDASDAEHSGMISILGMELDQVEQICDQARGDWTLDVANLLCPGNIVVSGNAEACMRAADLANEAGAMKVVPLAVAGAFHTTLMKPAEERLYDALHHMQIKPPRIPVISNVDARPHDDPQEIRNLLIKQVCSPVLWEASMRYLLDEVGIEKFYEIGPGRVLNGLLKRIARKVPCENVPA